MYMSIALTSSTTHSHSSSDPTQASASESLSTLRAPSLTHTSLHYRLPSTARTSLLPQHSPTNYAMLWNEGKRRNIFGAPMRSANFDRTVRKIQGRAQWRQRQRSQNAFR